MIQGEQPVVLQSMGSEWVRRFMLIHVLLRKALPWMDDNVLGYIAEFAVQKEYVSARARVYWSYMRPFRPPEASPYVDVNTGRGRRDNRGNTVAYNPPIRGPVGRALQIMGLTEDSQFAQFRSPVKWLTYLLRRTTLLVKGSQNRMANYHAGGSHVVGYTTSLTHAGNATSGTVGRHYDGFYGQDEAYWSTRPYTSMARHPTPVRYVFETKAP